MMNNVSRWSHMQIMDENQKNSNVTNSPVPVPHEIKCQQSIYQGQHLYSTSNIIDCEYDINRQNTKMQQRKTLFEDLPDMHQIYTNQNGIFNQCVSHYDLNRKSIEQQDFVITNNKGMHLQYNKQQYNENDGAENYDSNRINDYDEAMDDFQNRRKISAHLQSGQKKEVDQKVKNEYCNLNNLKRKYLRNNNQNQVPQEQNDSQREGRRSTSHNVRHQQNSGYGFIPPKNQTQFCKKFSPVSKQQQLKALKPCNQEIEETQPLVEQNFKKISDKTNLPRGQAIMTFAQMKKGSQVVPTRNNLRNILKTNFSENQKMGVCMTQQQIEVEIENQKLRREITELKEIPLEYQSLDMYVFIKNLGQGATAEVKLAKHKQLDVSIAMKIYDRKKMSAQSQKNLQREIEILYKMNHPNIIRLYHVINTEKNYHLAMEYSSPTCLNTFTRGRPFKRVTEEEAKIIFKQIMDAMGYLHEMNVMHRDLKLENLLIDNQTKKIKLIDFGYSVVLENNQKLSTSCGTPSYMSPEIVRKSLYSYPSDVWSCGIILYKIITGVFPFRGNNEKELYKKILSGKLEFPSFLTCSTKNILSWMLRLEQNERPSISELKQHQWLNE